MLDQLRRIQEHRWMGFFILAARLLLGWIFLGYGYSKLTEGQFGITEAELSTPVQDLSWFRLAWYLFDQQPFKAFIGIAQIIGAILLLVNRTVLLGAIILLPIITMILVIDLTFMPPGMATAFGWRLSSYLVLDLLILFHYQSRMKTVWSALTVDVRNPFKFKWWTYLLLPLAAIGLEVLLALIKFLTLLIISPEETWKALEDLINSMLN